MNHIQITGVASPKKFRKENFICPVCREPNTNLFPVGIGAKGNELGGVICKTCGVPLDWKWVNNKIAVMLLKQKESFICPECNTPNTYWFSTRVEKDEVVCNECRAVLNWKWQEEEVKKAKTKM